jgi:hypothetical protein
MLTLYSRHTEADPATGREACPDTEERFWKRCKCICWVHSSSVSPCFLPLPTIES